MHGARGSSSSAHLASTSTSQVLLAACLWLLVIGGVGPAQAAVLPTALTDTAWQTTRRLSSWFGGGGDADDTKQKTLGHAGGHAAAADRHHDDNGGFRWTSRGFASLGDSYSAGIGTHLDGGKEEACRLGLGAYPALLHSDLGVDTVDASWKWGGNKGGKGGKGGGDKTNITAFQWLSCTGATTVDVLGSSSASATPGQIDTLVTDPATAALDFITLSIGGNDLGFFDVINACVFRFYGYYSGTCEAALRAAEALIADDDDDDDASASFSASLTVILLQLLERVRWEKRPDFRVIVTGYAQFFNAETDLCDRCSMSVWWHYGNATGIPSNATDTTYLTKGLRRRMNNLVTGTNRKLKTIVANVNSRFSVDGDGTAGANAATASPPHILFIDYDAMFDGHRFCEPGVMEPDYKRDATWFFLVGGTDNDGEGKGGGEDGGDHGKDGKGKKGKDGKGKKGKKGKKSKKSGGGALFAPTVDPSSPLVDPARCRAPADARGDWGERALCDLVQARAADPGLLPVVGSVDMADNNDDNDVDEDANMYGNGRLVSPQNSMWYVPTYYGKTFHPRSNGHKAVRDTLYRVWEENGL